MKFSFASYIFGAFLLIQQTDESISVPSAYLQNQANFLPRCCCVAVPCHRRRRCRAAKVTFPHRIRSNRKAHKWQWQEKDPLSPYLYIGPPNRFLFFGFLAAPTEPPPSEAVRLQEKQEINLLLKGENGDGKTDNDAGVANKTEIKNKLRSSSFSCPDNSFIRVLDKKKALWVTVLGLNRKSPDRGWWAEKKGNEDCLKMLLHNFVAL